MKTTGRRSPATHLAAPLVGTGLLIAVYLLLRPYGDAQDATSPAAASAFASDLWVVSHLCGALALASLGRLALRVSNIVDSTGARFARATGLAGAVLVLPYYGAETFGLHAIGRAAGSDPSVLALVDDIRNHPAALVTFGLGLILLAVTGLTVARVWQRAHGSAAAWPLGILVALVLPQFYLPPVGRMAFGVAYLAAAGWWLLSLLRTAR